MKTIDFYVLWPHLRDGDIVSVKESFPSWNDRVDAVDGNMARPDGYGKTVECDICGGTFDVPSCMMEDRFFLPHLHGRGEIVFDGRVISAQKVEEFEKGLDQAMVQTIREGKSPLSVFR
jgi:hypothetical protein